MDDPEVARAHVIKSATSAIIMSGGFRRAEPSALEILSEMFAHFLELILNQVRLFCELQGRTEPTLRDVAPSLIELGVDLPSLLRYIKKAAQQHYPRIQAPSASSSHRPPITLQTSKAKPHPIYINDHFPVFPDPHTYIVTKARVNNEIDYLKVREILARQKFNMDKALVKFKLKNNLLKYSSSSNNSELLSIVEHSNELKYCVIRNEPEFYDNYLYLNETESDLLAMHHATPIQ